MVNKFTQKAQGALSDALKAAEELGYPVIIAGVLIVMYVPLWIHNVIKTKKNPPV